MKKIVAASFATLFVALPAQAAEKQPVHTCQLGDLKLESGQVIPGFRMTYITFGTLNEKKSNAILSLHGLQGNRNNQSYWVGAGKAFDPAKYFDMLKAGGSKHHSELLAPFGLDASKPEFWGKGLKVIEGMIDELERM